MIFEWDANKEQINIAKHGVDFETAKKSFEDSNRLITEDTSHSGLERRLYCFGKVDERVLTVRFTMRAKTIRIIGAGYWRDGRKRYEKGNSTIY